MPDRTRRPTQPAGLKDSSMDRSTGTARKGLRRAVACAALLALVLLSWSASVAYAAPGPAPSPKNSQSPSATSSPNKHAAPRSAVRKSSTPKSGPMQPSSGAGATATPLASGASQPAQALSIAVDDGKASATKGDRLRYTVTVQNTGTAAARALQISQSMPAGLRLGSADHRAVVTAGADPRVRWTVDIKPGAATVLHTTATVQVTPGALLRLASVACASAGAKIAPIVCAADSDLLPAGAAASTASAATPSSSSSADYPMQRQGMWFASGTILLALLVLSVLLRRRRNRARRETTSDMSPTSPSPVPIVKAAANTVRSDAAPVRQHEDDHTGGGSRRPRRSHVLRPAKRASDQARALADSFHD